jgi:hypothetical protein
MDAVRPQNVTRRLRPLTERVLELLRGPRLLWIVVWVMVPWLNAGANLLLETGARSAIWEQSRTLVLLNYGAVSFAVLVTQWGSRRIARRLEALCAETSNIFGLDSLEPFRWISSVRGPLIASVATAVGFGVSTLVEGGWTAAFLRGATWFLVGIPLWTFVWTYASLQLRLDRLGDHRLLRDAAPVDPGLGLRPLGGVAFIGLWMLLVWLVPVLLTGLPDVVGIALGLLVLAAALAAFFLSMVRLHRQMVAVKERELAVARALYAQAYEPVRAAPTLESLERQNPLMSAADALEKRAHAIHEWPIDEGTLARVLTITTSVIAMMIARLILEPLGL